MRLLLATALVLAAAATPAQAATVRVVSHCYKIDCSHEAVFTAAAGERNDLAVTTTERPRTVTFRDAGAPVTAGRACEALDEHTARCGLPLGPPDEWLIGIARLGDGADRASADRGLVEGGPGDDRLAMAFGALSGGPGSDVLRASDRQTHFFDEDGDLPARDRYLGRGRASLSYAGRRSPVRVDLAAGRAGSRGERDIVRGVSRAIGGSGDDVLLGTSGPDRLEGGPGADLLEGRAGDDRLWAALEAQPGRAPWRDVLRGGAGRDTLTVSADAERARRLVDCGPGRDRVSEALPRDRIAASCERVGIDSDSQLVRLQAVMARVSAPFAVDRRCWCDGYRARSRGRTVAFAEDRGGHVALRLNALGRRLLAARGHLRVSVLRNGWYSGFTTELRLRRPACGPAGDTLAAGRDARVYARGGTLVGCHRRRGAPIQLGDRGELLGVRVAGRYAAVALRERYLRVVDLRRGRVEVTGNVRLRGLTALRLTGDGAAATISRGRDGVPVVDSPASTLTADAGREIDPGYLRIAGNLYAWRAGGLYHAAAFDDGPDAGPGRLAATRQAGLEAREYWLYARHRRTGREVQLGRVDCSCISSSGFGGLAGVRLAGRFVAAREVSADFRNGLQSARILLADTEAGTLEPTCESGWVHGFVVTGGGGVACEVEVETYTVRRPTKQIRSGASVLDEGQGIELGSLRRRGGELVWQHDGAERTAPLPRRG